MINLPAGEEKERSTGCRCSDWELWEDSAGTSLCQALLLYSVRRFPGPCFSSERKGLLGLLLAHQGTFPGLPLCRLTTWGARSLTPGRKRLSAVILPIHALNPFSRAKETVTQFKQIISKCERKKTTTTPEIEEIGEEQIRSL